MQNERGTMLIEFVFAMLPVLLLACFSFALSFGLLKIRVRDYELLQKAKLELREQSGDAYVSAGRRSLWLRH